VYKEVGLDVMSIWLISSGGSRLRRIQCVRTVCGVKLSRVEALPRYIKCLLLCKLFTRVTLFHLKNLAIFFFLLNGGRINRKVLDRA
jgi:hypothetical protein